MDKKVIGERIRAYMKKYKLTQSQVASDFGMKQSSVSDMISGRRDTFRLAMEMSEHYKISREVFFGDDMPLYQEIAHRDIVENGLSKEEKLNLVRNLEALYRKHQALLDDASKVMKEIAAINKLLIVGTNTEG